MDGSFRPAAFRRGVMPHDAPAMQAIRAQMAAALEAGAAPFVPTSSRWSLQQWEDWEAWSNPLLVVDWAGQGLPDWEFVRDEEDDEGVFMQLTAAEEDILHRMQVPDEVRRRIRDMLRTLVNHQNEDVGAEYRWGLRRWLLAWQEGCTQLGQVVEILQQRVQGPVAYYPVVRDPRGRAQRERCIGQLFCFRSLRRWWMVPWLLGVRLNLRVMLCVPPGNAREVGMVLGLPLLLHLHALEHTVRAGW